MTATKSDLVKAVAEANGFPRNKSTELIEVSTELRKTNRTVEMLCGPNAD